MNVINNSFEIRREQGFDVYVLANQTVEVSVVPELGARIISLKQLQTKREWMWHPPDGLKLFRNHFGDDFSRSPLVGADECLPTIAPCFWQNRHLPDHGEIWSVSWQVNSRAWQAGVLQTHVRLKISPFEFTRTVELLENEIRIEYRLENRSPVEERYLWAMHPLLHLRAGDQLELPASTRDLLKGERWIDAVNSALPENNHAKVFATPLSEGFAAINNPTTGERLEFEWNPAENNTLGLWLTRGGWHGLHHFALEPTNGDDDALTLAAERKRCGTVAAYGHATWQMSWRVQT